MTMEISRTCNVQFLDPEPKSAGVKSKDGSSAAFTIDLPTGFLEDFQNMLPLHCFKIFKRSFRLVSSLEVKIIRKLKNRSLAGDDSSFYDVLQLPYITGPLVILKNLHCALGYGLNPLAAFSGKLAYKMIDKLRDIL